MANICWVVPKIKSNQFTGGIYSILRHADGLAKKGHSVSVVPLLDSQPPNWLPDYRFNLHLSSKWSLAKKIFQSKWAEEKFESKLHAFTAGLMAVEPRVLPFSVRHAIMCERARIMLSEADLTIATSFETVLPVCLHGKGILAYYAQHFEPFFANEFDDPAYSNLIARGSYYCPVKIITNSSWLKEKIFSETGINACAVAGNAIDESMFLGENKCSNQIIDQKLRVISYGGRDAAWKGFVDMAQGVRKARERGLDIEWSVYGACTLSPNNSIANFKDLGFLNQEQLAVAYRNSHVLLSASWYESFPLFPLEAMAAGLAVITTQAGTESFARHMDTAWVVPSKNPDALCNALIEIAKNSQLRNNLGAAAAEEARKHTWTPAVNRMENILLNLLD